jgi:hypothetical protein
MKLHRFSFSVFALVVMVDSVRSATPSAAQIQQLVRGRPELDEITWKDAARGMPLKVRIVEATGQAVTVEKTLPAGLTTRKIPFSDLADLSFSFTSRELALHRVPAVASIPPLRVYWENRSATLCFAGSNVADTGLVLAKSLRLAGDLPSLMEAAKILDQIRGQDSAKHRVELASSEQMAIDFILSRQTGKIQETDKLAWEITEQAVHNDATLLATAFLADRHFSQLKATEEANPRWMEDDEVRPLRERLYHLSLDFALYPSLFMGTRHLEASAGLKRVAEVYEFTGAKSLAMKALEDLAALYPDTAAAIETAPLLARYKALEASGKLAVMSSTEAPKEETEAPSEEATDPGPPPPPKRYNIFGD